VKFARSRGRIARGEWSVPQFFSANRQPGSVGAGGAHEVAVSGLVDSGAAINVLPYAIGSQLGFDWTQQKTTVELSGNLEMVEAKAIVESAVVGDFALVRQAFAWAKTDSIPVILGQVNFFLEFDVRPRGST
jgi:hypothetical protein